MFFDGARARARGGVITMKSTVMVSATARQPAAAMPIDAEVKPSSEIPVSMKRCGGRTARGDQGRLMPGERVAAQPEVIRAIVSDYSPCFVGSRTVAPNSAQRPFVCW